jgi:opacity protein-like surface antigen
MRRLFVALALTGFASGAFAGEYELPEMPILRGSTPYVPAPPTYRRWEGFYGGGQLSLGTGNFDYAGSTSSLVSYILRNSTAEDVLHASEWTTLPKTSKTSTGAGGFVGYNVQYDDVILGVEVNYVYMPFKTSVTDYIGRFRVLDNVRYDVAITSEASMNIIDYGTLRGRLGYVIGPVLPYATFGLAVARVNTTRSATVTEAEYNVTDPNNPVQIGGLGTVSNIDSRTGVFAYGYSTGAGFDWMLSPNVFARAEFEYVYFPNTHGIKAQLTTGRVGMGLKF